MDISFLRVDDIWNELLCRKTWHNVIVPDVAASVNGLFMIYQVFTHPFLQLPGVHQVFFCRLAQKHGISVASLHHLR
jgi:hypothetical protein